MSPAGEQSPGVRLKVSPGGTCLSWAPGPTAVIHVPSSCLLARCPHPGRGLVPGPGTESEAQWAWRGGTLALWALEPSLLSPEPHSGTSCTLGQVLASSLAQNRPLVAQELGAVRQASVPLCLDVAWQGVQGRQERAGGPGLTLAPERVLSGQPADSSPPACFPPAEGAPERAMGRGGQQSPIGRLRGHPACLGWQAKPQHGLQGLWVAAMASVP